ncbi:MAG: PLP-dependent aminotransferase family protein [Proteobacteria bacterium]|nr:MAG: PLP-dependent aminotransferase family protein [Pseudomonadota bacterium]
MNQLFSDRIADVPQSFIREILKIAIDPSVISFAGGLPNRTLFPVDAIREAADRILRTAGGEVLQYSNSEGYRPLREWIAQRYRERQGLEIAVENILITTGSQQGLDLLGKTLINDHDPVVMEEPGYLGAIQAFSLYRPRFLPVPVHEAGMNIDRLQDVLRTAEPRLLYTVANFQNPAGITYSEANREAVAALLKGKRTFLVQDDPYGELRFSGQHQRSFAYYLPEQTLLLGSFSKTVVPAFRIGWIVAPDRLMEKLVIAKQASDLHTDFFAQRVLYQYLQDNDLDAHIARITEVYGRQRDAMVQAIENHFPAGVHATRPEGGMFLWVTLPEGVSSMHLFEQAIRDKVAFVPGHPFYIGRTWTNDLRLNFSCVDDKSIAIGIERLARALALQVQAA